jgi:hypothetical protein
MLLHGLQASSAPSSPISAKVKWTAVLQRVHDSTVHFISNRKSTAAALAPVTTPPAPKPSTSAAPALASLPTTHQHATPNTDSPQWGSLKQRLREVKLSQKHLSGELRAQSPQRTSDSDNGSTVITDSTSVVEEQLHHLLAQQPPVTAAVVGQMAPSTIPVTYTTGGEPQTTTSAAAATQPPTAARQSQSNSGGSDVLAQPPVSGHQQKILLNSSGTPSLSGRARGSQTDSQRTTDILDLLGQVAACCGIAEAAGGAPVTWQDVDAGEGQRQLVGWQ